MFVPADTLDDLLNLAIGEIIKQGVAVASSRGDNLELRGVLLKLTNPRARLSHTEKKGKVFSAIGEMAWYLAASNDAAFITYYIPAYKDETEDDGTVHGAYGPRFFGPKWNSQYENVINTLRQKPASRQAVIQVFDSRDLTANAKDIPCTCTLHFMVRHNQLDLVVTMRSNDVFRGLPHDVFSFTMLQEITARTLGVDLGQYIHFAGSLHLYDSDKKNATSYLGEGWQSKEGAAMPAMPTGDPWQSIHRFLAAEEAIRTAHDPAEHMVGLSTYWLDLIALLRVFWSSKNGDSKAVTQLKSSIASPIYRQYIAMRETSRSGRSAGQTDQSSSSLAISDDETEQA